jgi:tetratricopeptide (TPR) repeat protein
LRLAEDGGDPAELSDQYLQLGRCYVELGEFKKAEAFVEKSLTLAQKLSDSRRAGLAIVQRAFVHNSKGDYDGSLKTNLHARRIFEDGGFLHDLANVKVLIAVDLIQMGRNEDAVRSLEEAIVLSRRIGDLQTLAYALWTASGLYVTVMPDFVKGETYLEEAGDIFARLREVQQMGMVHFYRAIIARQRGDWALAENEYRAAFEILRDYAAPELLTDCCIHFAYVLLGRGDVKEARAYFEEAQRLIERGGFLKFLPKVREGLRATEMAVAND